MYKTALDLTDVISPELVKNVREYFNVNNRRSLDAGPILMRKSGDTIFADITISLKRRH